jgi:hypothetical protein
VRRLHLIELEDQPWFPAVLRDPMTDLLNAIIETGRLYDPIVPLLRAAIEESGADSILDLCSGGGGPLPRIRRLLAQEHGLDVPARLSDFYPNLPAFERIAAAEGGRVGFVRESVDATRVPAELTGFRTMFTCLHHFRPEQARAILRDACEHGRGIGVFEFTERSARGLATMLLSPLSVAALTPFIRPFRWSRLALTYALPVIPAAFFFDGVVSHLRSYTPDELRALTRPLQSSDYRWEIGQVIHPIFRAPLTYVVGQPA